MLPLFLRRLPLFVLAALSLLGLPALASTLTVPAQYPIIQAAVNASASGDTVLIADGTYTGPGNVDIDFGGRNITVTSQHGPASTIIDCGGNASANHRGFYLHSGETSAVISGLTIQNGYESYNSATDFASGRGAGILILSASATIQNCIIKSNTAGAAGGGVSVFNLYYNAAVTLQQCLIAANSASTGPGGGVENDNQDGTITLTGCTLTGNTANTGGGVFNQSSGSGTIALINCVIPANTATTSGAGVYNDSYNSGSGLISMTNCTLTANHSPSGAGGGTFTFNRGGLVTLTNCIFFGDYGNEIDHDPGNTSNPVASYCDSQNGDGGGVTADPLFVRSPYDLHLHAGSPCLGAGTATGAPAVTADGRTRPSPPSIGAYEAAAGMTSATTLTSSLNPSNPSQSVTFTATVTAPNQTPTGTIFFTVDGFAQPPAALNGSGTAAYTTSSLAGGTHTITAAYSGSMALAPSMSPALTQTVNITKTTTSLASSPSPSVYGQNVTFTATVTGSNPTGTVTFTDATNSAVLGAGNVSGGIATFSTSALIGGSHQITASYAGDSYNTASTSAALTQAVTAAGTTTILTSSLNPSSSGQSVTFAVNVGQRAGTPASTPTGTVAFSVDGAVLYNVSLSNGYYAAYSTSALTVGTHTVKAVYSGDGNYAASTSAALTQIVNAHISPQYVSPAGSDNNSGTQAAPKLTIQAAMTTALSGDTVVVENGTYTGPGNVDLRFGGKILTVTSQNGATKTIIDCGGSANANHNGFSLSPNYGSAEGSDGGTISGFTIQNGYENTSGNYSNGGAIYCYGVGVTIQNCIIKNNTASEGGGIYALNFTHTPTLILNCVFTGNTATYGGGLYAYASDGGSITLTNCTLTGNMALGSTTAPPGTANGGGIVISSNSGSTVTLTNTIAYGDTGGEIAPPSGATGISVTYCDIQGGYAGTGNIDADPLFVNASTDLHLQPDSPCLGAGTASGAPATAIDGAVRPSPPSIGAYEEYLAPTMVVVTNASGTAGQTVTLSAMLNPGSRGLPGATLQFSVDGVAVGAAATGDNSTSSGPARISYTIPAGFAAGSHSITAAFAGDAANAASSGTGTLTVTAPASTAATQVRFFPRVGYEYRMVGGKFQGSPDGSTYTDLATITQTPARGVYTTVTFAQPAAYRYLRYLSPNGGYGNVAEVEFDSGTGTSLAKISGTPFGTAGSYGNSGNDFTKVFDGNTGTFFDAPSANGVFAGIDQGAPGVQRGEVHFTPRAGFASRMVGGKFQGSSDGTTYTDLYTITSQPAQASATVVLPSDPKSYRYLRYLSPNNGYGNVAEVAFYSGTGASAVKLTGTLFGTPGSYANSGNDYTKVFDGNPATFFDAPTGNGDFAGVDQGAP